MRGKIMLSTFLALTLMFLPQVAQAYTTTSGSYSASYVWSGSGTDYGGVAIWRGYKTSGFSYSNADAIDYGPSGNFSGPTATIPLSMGDNVLTIGEVKGYSSTSSARNGFSYLNDSKVSHITVTRVPAEPPKITVSYSDTNWTNNNVIANIVITNYGVASLSSGILLSGSGGSRTFTSNGSDIVTASANGLSSSETLIVSNIDKIKPNIITNNNKFQNSKIDIQSTDNESGIKSIIIIN